MRVLREGVSGEDVRAWQNFLLGQGFYWLEVDGRFDEGTRDATKSFQGSVPGLDCDGVVGNATYAAAMALGLMVLPDHDDASLSGPNWPARPDALKPLTASQRGQLFGSFSYKPAPQPGNPEAVQPDAGWAAANIVAVTVPQLKGVKGAPHDLRVAFHKRGARRLEALFRAWEAAGLSALVLTWGGSYAPRFVRGSRTYLSNHAWATAFDVNVQYNPLGATPALAGRTGSVRELVPLANEHGFYWGGHFSGRPDGMHFELAEAD